MSHETKDFTLDSIVLSQTEKTDGSGLMWDKRHKMINRCVTRNDPVFIFTVTVNIKQLTTQQLHKEGGRTKVV